MSRKRRFKFHEGTTKKRTPQCCGKTTYPSQGRALNALNHIKVQDAQAVAPTEVPPTDVYECLHGRWHLTAGKGVTTDG